MTLTEGSFSFLTRTQSTFTPAPGFLNVGEPMVNVADARLFVGNESGGAFEIGLNAKSAIVGDTAKYLQKEYSNDELILLPYSPANLTDTEYFEFYIYFTFSDNAAVRSVTYSPGVDWGSISDPLNLLADGETILIKFFAFGNAPTTDWYAIPVWTSDDNLSINGGSVESKRFYTQILNPQGTLITPQRNKVQFTGSADVTVFDNAIDETTVVAFNNNLVNRVEATLATYTIDYDNLSRFYIFNDTDVVDPPGGGSPSEPFSFIIKNNHPSDNLTANMGSPATVLAPGESLEVLFDGVEYHLYNL